MPARKRSKAGRRAISASCTNGSRRRAEATRRARITPIRKAPQRTTTMTNPIRSLPDEILIGLVSISDRATSGVYEDKGIPALQAWLGAALASPWRAETRLIQDDA